MVSPGVSLVDITSDYVQLRYGKSEWEREQIRAAFALADFAYDAMKEQIKPGVSEIQVAAAGEYAARSRGASGFGFSAIVGSGVRSNAVVPTASSKLLQEGEMAMIGIAPKVCGYAGVVGDALPVNGRCSQRQQACMQHLKEAFRLTKAQLLARARSARRLTLRRGCISRSMVSRNIWSARSCIRLVCTRPRRRSSARTATTCSSRA